MFLLKRHVYFACCVSSALICFIAANVEFSARQNEYFESDSITISARSGLECSTGCGLLNESCEAVNYNTQTSECEVLAQRPTEGDIEPRQNWTLYTRKSDDCEVNWVLFVNKCYLYVDDPTHWSIADTYCQSIDAELVEVHSLEKDEFVGSFIDGRYATWLGLKGNATYQFYEWLSGTPVTYTAFKLTSRTYECAVFYNTGSVYGWYDLSCLNPTPYICEKPKLEDTP